jgi:hypothetical protein
VLPRLFADEGLFATPSELRAAGGRRGLLRDPQRGPQAPTPAGATARRARLDRRALRPRGRDDDPDERQKLFDALVRSHFKAYLGTTHGYVGHRPGPGELSRHARSLGFDAVVFFFDEAVLWLASGASDRAWVTREMSKLAKMVESQEADRPAPLVSFLARQRDIVELVGDQLAGGDLLALREAQRFWEGRFGTIPLPDRNLPAIVRKRVVRPKDEAAAKRLDEAFEAMRRKLGTTAWQTLLGDIGEGEEAFRAVYPFSPALIQVLVGMSAALQRERTALKVLMEILVEHLEDFDLGRLVAVGDLFDVLAGGEEPMDGVLREQFQTMRTKYQQEFLPLVQLTQQDATRRRSASACATTTPAGGLLQLRRGRCRADNRLMKTLLLATLLPNVSVLKEFTVSRLVALNHGTLRSTIPGTEVGHGGDASAGVRRADRRPCAWATRRTRWSTSSCPRWTCAPVLESAREHDKPGARKVKLRALLFAAFGHTGWDLTEFARRSSGAGPPARARCSSATCASSTRAAFASHGARLPHRDRLPLRRAGAHAAGGRVARRDAGDRLDERTVVWLPDFFSDTVQTDLGMLVVLDAVLAGDAWKTYLSHLRADDQQRARQSLESLRSQKQNRVLRAIESAYGITSGGDGMLDPSCTVGSTSTSSCPSVASPTSRSHGSPTRPTALASALLAECYPRAPEVPERRSQARARQRAEAARAAQRDAGAADGHRPAERKEGELCAALNLVVLREADAVMRDEFRRARARPAREGRGGRAHRDRGGVRGVLDPAA